MLQEQIKKIFSHSLIYGVGNILNRFLGFLLLPVYTHYFPPAEFGIFSLLYAFWFFAGVFYLYGMETSFQKYFVEAKDVIQRKKIFGSTLILILITSLIFSFLIYINSGSLSKIITGNSNNFYLVKLLAIILLIDAVSRFPMIILNALEKSKLFTFINISTVIVSIFFNILFIIIYQYGIEAIFYSFLISYSYQLIVSFIFCLKYFDFIFDKEQIKVLTGFGFAFLFYGFFIISLDLIDRFILGYFKGEKDVGIYSACYRIGMAMNLVISGFRAAWIPFFLNLKGEKDNKEIFSKVFSYFSYGAMLLFLIIALFANDVVRIRIGDFSFLDMKYWSGMIIVPYILSAYFFYGLFTNVLIASYYENKIKYIIISSCIGCISNIIFNLILIPLYSIKGAAIATLLSYFLMFIFLYLFSQRVYYIKYEWNKIIPVILLTLILYLGNTYIYDIFSWIQNKVYFIYFVKFISVGLLILVLYYINSKKLPKPNNL